MMVHSDPRVSHDANADRKVHWEVIEGTHMLGLGMLSPLSVTIIVPNIVGSNVGNAVGEKVGSPGPGVGRIVGSAVGVSVGDAVVGTEVAGASVG